MVTVVASQPEGTGFEPLQSFPFPSLSLWLLMLMRFGLFTSLLTELEEVRFCSVILFQIFSVLHSKSGSQVKNYIYLLNFESNQISVI